MQDIAAQLSQRLSLAEHAAEEAAAQATRAMKTLKEYLRSGTGDAGAGMKHLIKMSSLTRGV
jgi:hypothetical protein